MAGSALRSPEGPPGGAGAAARIARQCALAAAVVAVLALSAHIAEVRPGVLFSPATRASVLAFVRQMFPPSLDGAFLRVALLATVRTLAIAVAGTVLAIALGLPLSVLATKTLWSRGVVTFAEDRGPAFALRLVVHVAARGLLRFLRAVPDLLWALVFVVAFGLGPLPGALALGVSYAGVVGRVFADLFEEAPALPLEALHASGASRLQIFLCAIVPQTSPGIVAYSLYSFECCVRAAAVLGFVGAGGLGYEISVSMRLFEYGQITTLLALFLLLVAATDAFSRSVRRRSRRAGELLHIEESLRRRHFLTRSRAGGTPSPLGGGRGLRAVLWLLFAAAVVACFREAGFVAADGGASSPLALRVVRFAAQLVPPDFSAPFLRSLVEPIAQTLGISVMGTVIGIVVGGALAVPSIATLAFPSAEEPGRRSLLAAVARAAAYAGARFVLALLRSIPELLWVLLCIVAVGLGPFAGTLALGLHTAGVLGKLFAETLEEVPEGPLVALRAAGASPLQVLLLGMWPQARGTLVSYAMLRWENNLRVATVVGMVGGGGLGIAMYNSVQLGFYPRVATLILVVYLLVVGTDWLADRARARGRSLEQEPERAVRELAAVQA
jgi:phosphonate transport system permease protein